MLERDFDAEFFQIVRGQLPSTKERLKNALDDAEVQAGFLAVDPDDLSDPELYLDFVGFVAEKHLLFPNEVSEVAGRIATKTMVSRNV